MLRELRSCLSDPRECFRQAMAVFGNAVHLCSFGVRGDSCQVFFPFRVVAVGVDQNLSLFRRRGDSFRPTTRAGRAVI